MHYARESRYIKIPVTIWMRYDKIHITRLSFSPPIWASTDYRNLTTSTQKSSQPNNSKLRASSKVAVRRASSTDAWRVTWNSPLGEALLQTFAQLPPSPWSDCINTKTHCKFRESLTNRFISARYQLVKVWKNTTQFQGRLYMVCTRLPPCVEWDDSTTKKLLTEKKSSPRV